MVVSLNPVIRRVDIVRRIRHRAVGKGFGIVVGVEFRKLCRIRTILKMELFNRRIQLFLELQATFLFGVKSLRRNARHDDRCQDADNRHDGKQFQQRKTSRSFGSDSHSGVSGIASKRTSGRCHSNIAREPSSGVTPISRFGGPSNCSAWNVQKNWIK